MDVKTQDRLAVNYEQTDADVYSIAFKACIQEEGTIRAPCFLWECFLHAETSIPNLPSWCPDFSMFSPPQDRNPLDNGKALISAEVRLKYIDRLGIDLDTELHLFGVSGPRLDQVARCTNKAPQMQASDDLEDPEDVTHMIAGPSFAAERFEWLMDLLRTYSRYETEDDFRAQVQDFIRLYDKMDSVDHPDAELQLLLRPCDLWYNIHLKGDIADIEEELRQK